jgi:hypothetical protein
LRFVINPFTEKLDVASITGSGSPPTETITGNDGVPVPPNGVTYNINLLGSNLTGLNVTGNAGTNTLTIYGLPSSITQVGTTAYATNTEAAAQSSSTVALTPSNIPSMFSTHYLPSSQGGTGLSSPAAHSLIVTEGSSAYTVLGVAGNGQLPIGSIGSDPVLANITSSGSTITVTNGPGTINLDVSGSVATTYITNSGNASPSGGNLDILGNYMAAGSGDPVFVTGSGHTVIVNVQLSEAAASSSGNNAGICSFSSADFSVDANGYVTFTGSGAAETLTGNTGGAISPSAGNINTLGTGSITIAGSGSTLTTQLTGLTNNSVLVGAGTATITSLATADSAVLVTSAGGIPSISTTLPAGLTTTQLSITGTPSANTDATNVLYVQNALATVNPGTSVYAATTTNIPGTYTIVGAGVGDTFLTTATGSFTLDGTTPAVGSRILFKNQSTTLQNGVYTLTTNGTGITGTLFTRALDYDTANNVNSTGVIAVVNGTVNQLTGWLLNVTVTTVSVSPITYIQYNAAPISTTQYAVLVGGAANTVVSVGPGSAGQVLQSGGNAANPVYSTSTYPATNAINTLLYASSANTMAALATANNGVLTTGTSGTPVITALGTDGQVIIGSSAGAPAAATLTAGTGVSITNGHNTITIATTGTTVLTVTALTHASSPYTVLSTDDFLAITGSVGTFTVKLPNAPTTGRVIIIKDTNGVAATDNIAVTTVGGSVTIDGSTTYTMATNYQSISVIFDGTNYEVF